MLAILKEASGEEGGRMVVGGWEKQVSQAGLLQAAAEAHSGNYVSSLQPFLPSFPAEGNNLSPEQIKSDLHEI